MSRRLIFVVIFLLVTVFLGAKAILPNSVLGEDGKESFRLKPRTQNHVAICGNEGAGSAHCHARVLLNNQGKPDVTSSLPFGYGPAQFQTAYNLPASASGRTIAIVDAYSQPNIVADLAIYNSTFGLPAFPVCPGGTSSGCLSVVNQFGGSSLPFADSGWGLEISLDVEVAHAACPSCKLVLVEANSSSYTDLMTAVDQAVAQGATAVSNSYGSREFSGETSFDFHFNHPGVAFTFSSGDSGYGPGYPAASRYVTSVGGTSLFLNSNNSWNSEVVWSGTGSGCSRYESKPSFQHDKGCSRRTQNDVAADADPNTGAAVYDSFGYGGSSGWFQVGGTSLSSPLIAATYALAGVGSSVQANSLPYSHPSFLRDITSGRNGVCSGSTSTRYLCNAGPGYDGPTGLGTPNGLLAF